MKNGKAPPHSIFSTGTALIFFPGDSPPVKNKKLAYPAKESAIIRHSTIFKRRLTRRKYGIIFGPLMLIRCLSCETGAHFVSEVALNLKKLRILRRMRLECSSETLLIGPLITRRSQVQVLSPQPQNPRTATVLGFFCLLKWGERLSYRLCTEIEFA